MRVSTMFRMVVLGLIAGAALIGCGGNEPPPREVPLYSIADFLATTNYRGLSFSPGQDKILVSSDASGVYNAYAVPVDGSDPEQLTFSDGNAVMARAYFPGDERFIFTQDRGGNELSHVYVQIPEGNALDLTPGDGLAARFYGWARDDSVFYVATNERNGQYFDVYEYSPATYGRTLLYQNDDGLDFGAVSPDRRYLALTRDNTTSDTDLYLVDRETGDTTMIAGAGDEETINNPQDFNPEGTALYFLTDEGHEFRYLVRYDIASGERETVLEPDWDILRAGFSKDGRRLVVSINNDARTEVQVYDYPGMLRVGLPELPSADITAVTYSADGSHMAFYASSGRDPRDLFVVNGAGGAPVRLTRSLSPEIDREDLVAGKVVRFKSTDDVTVPGILYRPHPASGDNKVPALVWVHGGPGGQSRIGYSGLIQFLVNHGYAVYAINNRGSSGYGKTFYRMDDRKHGEGDLDDCVASKKMLQDTGYVLDDRIGIIGGSYGGYMVLAALAFRPDAFAAGVDMFGISNWIRTLESIPPWWESFRQSLYVEMGNPETDTAYLRSISPLFHANEITKPLLVLQGANDPRVLQVESDDIVEAVRANGVPVEYLVFDDEGHGFRKKENRIKAYGAILEFLKTHVPPEAEEGPES